MHLAPIYANLEITFALPLQILIINGVSFLKFPLTANRELDIGGLGAMMKYWRKRGFFAFSEILYHPQL